MKLKNLFVVFFCLQILMCNLSMSKEINLIKICESVKDIQVPIEDLPQLKDDKLLPTCNPASFYYGVDETIAYKKARYCAFKTQNYKILSLLYANGSGVERNNALALHFACLISEENRNQFVDLLVAYQKNNDYKQKFYGCDSENRFVANKCWSNELDKSQQEHYRSFQHFNENFLDLIREKTGLFQEKYYDYSDYRSFFEIENEDFLSLNYMFLENIKLLHSFFSLLEQISKCIAPQVDEKDYKKIDGELNRLYFSIRGDQQLFSKLNINDKARKLNDMKKTEQYWIKYKDGMSSLGHANCPNISQTSWSIVLTQERIQQLRDLQQRFK